MQEIDGKLQELSLQKVELSDEEMIQQQHLESERSSTRQCLVICAEVAEHMNALHLSTPDSTRPDTSQAVISVLGDSLFASRVTRATIQECKDRIANTTRELETHLHRVNNRLGSFTLAKNLIGEGTEEKQIREEKECLEQCLGICAGAAGQVDQVRTNVVEDISSGHGSFQVVVATLGDLIAARRVVTGDKSTQWVGQMSDTALQQLSRDRDRDRASVEKAEHEGSQNHSFVKRETAEDFEHRHGTGFRLKPEYPFRNSS